MQQFQDVRRKNYYVNLIQSLKSVFKLSNFLQNFQFLKFEENNLIFLIKITILIFLKIDLICSIDIFLFTQI